MRRQKKEKQVNGTPTTLGSSSGAMLEVAMVEFAMVEV